jgi:hypothetical protein
MLDLLLACATQLYSHEGDHDILDDHDHHEERSHGKKIIAAVISAVLVLAFVVWRLV